MYLKIFSQIYNSSSYYFSLPNNKFNFEADPMKFWRNQTTCHQKTSKKSLDILLPNLDMRRKSSKNNEESSWSASIYLEMSENAMKYPQIT